VSEPEQAQDFFSCRGTSISIGVDELCWVLGVDGVAATSGIDLLSAVGDMIGIVCVGLLAWVILPFGVAGHGWGELIGGHDLICVGRVS